MQFQIFFCFLCKAIIKAFSLLHLHSPLSLIWVPSSELILGSLGLGPISLSPFLSLCFFLILPLSYPLFFSFHLYLFFLIGGGYSSSNNGSVSSSCNTLHIFSLFVSLSSVIFLCSSLFFSIYFSNYFLVQGNLSLCSHLPDCFLAYLLSPCYYFCFQSLGVSVFSSLTLFCSSMGEFLSLPLWGSLVFSLYFCFSSCPSQIFLFLCCPSHS